MAKEEFTASANNPSRRLEDGLLVSPQQRVIEEIIRSAPAGPSSADMIKLREYSSKQYKKLIAAPCDARRTHARDLFECTGIKGEWFAWPGVDERPSAPTILYLHGGGYVMLNVDVYAGYLSHVSRISGRRVLAIDYRLLPEHDMSDAVADAVGTLKFLVTEMKVLPGSIAIMGDSAGGGLTLLTVQHLINNNVLPAPIGALGLISPYTDVSNSGKSCRNNTDPQFSNRNREEAKIHDRNITQGKYDRKDPRISPLFGSFDNFPPMRFVVSRSEMLFDDTMAAAEKARRSGVEVEVEVVSGSLHDLPLFFRITEGPEATARMLYWINRHLPSPPSHL